MNYKIFRLRRHNTPTFVYKPTETMKMTYQKNYLNNYCLYFPTKYSKACKKKGSFTSSRDSPFSQICGVLLLALVLIIELPCNIMLSDGNVNIFITDIDNPGTEGALH